MESITQPERLRHAAIVESLQVPDMYKGCIRHETANAMHAIRMGLEMHALKALDIGDINRMIERIDDHMRTIIALTRIDRGEKGNVVTGK